MICTYGEMLDYCTQRQDELCMFGGVQFCTHPRIGGTPDQMISAAQEAKEAGLEHYGVFTGGCGAVFVIPLEPYEDEEDE